MSKHKGAWAAALCGLAAVGGATVLAAGQEQPATPAVKAAAAAAGETAEIGKPVKDFTFRDIMAAKTAKPVRLSDFKGKKAVALVFMANRCGTTWSYEQKIGKFLGEYGKKGVAVMAVHSNYQETDAEIKGQMEQRNLAMPILDDKQTQAFANYVGARVTPTFLVIDKNGVLQYRGSFDKRGDDATAYVVPAADAVIAGKPVTLATTRAFG